MKNPPSKRERWQGCGTGNIATEQRNLRLAHMGGPSTLDRATRINSEDHRVADAAQAALRVLRRNGMQERTGMDMAITINLYYTGKNGSARAFAEEMVSSGTVRSIQNEPGNLRYEYFLKMDDPETVLLIDSWASQAAIDQHHASPMMKTIMELREKYDLHMRVERYLSDEAGTPESDRRFIRE